MKKIILFLLYAIAISACSDSEGGENKKRMSDLAGLYRARFSETGNSSYYIYLYPDGKLVRHKDNESTSLKWTLEEGVDDKLTVVDQGENVIQLNGFNFDKRKDHPSPVDKKLLGTWEMEHIKIANPVKYDELTQEVSYLDNTVIKEYEISCGYDYVESPTGFASKTMRITAEGVIIQAHYWLYGGSSCENFNYNLYYDHAIFGDKGYWSMFSSDSRHKYEIKGDELIVSIAGANSEAYINYRYRKVK